MNISRGLILVLSALLMLINKSQGQNREVNNTTQLWSEVDLLGEVTKKIKWQCDIQYSRQSAYENLDFVKYAEQLTVRAWVHYFIKPTVKLSSFVGTWYNFHIDDNVGQREFPEYRFALQAQFYKIFGRNTLSYRIRPEFREIKDAFGNYEFVVRGRLMAKYQRLFNREVYERGSCYGILQDELFGNDGSAVTGYKSFDQNRIFVGLGFYLSNDVVVETGYFNQFVHHAHDIHFDNNNNWQVSLILNNLTKAKAK